MVYSDYYIVPCFACCFSFFDDSRPLFLDVIPAAMDYDEAVELNRERDLEEIRKILVQKIPHLASDGTLLFEPDEAQVMHDGAVGMMKGNKNISVLTTYADVDAVVSKTSSEAVTNTLEKALQNVYSKGSVSGQVFAPTGSQALSTSITNDMSLMMILGNKYSKFISYIINSLFANSNINFKYIEKRFAKVLTKIYMKLFFNFYGKSNLFVCTFLKSGGIQGRSIRFNLFSFISLSLI